MTPFDSLHVGLGIMDIQYMSSDATREQSFGGYVLPPHLERVILSLPHWTKIGNIYKFTPPEPPATVRPAFAIVGHILYDPRKDRQWFRVYDLDKYTDYEIAAEDIQVQILSNALSLIESGDRKELTWTPNRRHKSEHT